MGSWRRQGTASKSFRSLWRRRVLLSLAVALTLSPAAQGSTTPGEPENRYVPGATLTVTSALTLPYQREPYRVASVEVTASGVLTIAPGVLITVQPFGSIRIAGTLLAVGTALQPIRITAAASTPWGTLALLPESGASMLAFVELSGFTGPVHIEGYGGAQQGEVAIADLTFIGASSNCLEVGSAAWNEVKLQLARLTFQSGPGVTCTGVTAVGRYDDVEFNRIEYLEQRPYTLVPWGLFTVGITGWYGSVHFRSILVPYDCSTVFTAYSPPTEIAMGVDPHFCARRRSATPVVFLPGIGGSMNLAELVAPPDGTPDSNGWVTLPNLVPAYGTLLTALTNAGVPYTVASYDWRLSAETIVESYLRPAIDQVKRIYGSKTVNLVAHSYGGLIARAYIQGDQYQNDVSQLIQIGTPNAGAAIAYLAWAGGVLPPAWAPVLGLIRYYQYRDAALPLTSGAALRRYFPSVADLLPTYPVARTGGIVRDQAELAYQNRLLGRMNSSIDLLIARTKVTVVASDSEPTLFAVGLNRPGYPAESGDWLDGQWLGKHASWYVAGDGTVPWESASLPGAQLVRVAGTHAALPGVAAPTVVQRLAEGATPPPATPPHPFQVFLDFWFDCPVEVTVTAPDTRVYRTGGAYERDTAAVLQVPELTWFNLPAQAGVYQVQITALADGLVRGWVGDEAIQSWSLRDGETVSWAYRYDFPVAGGSDLPLSTSALPVLEPVAAVHPTATPSQLSVSARTSPRVLRLPAYTPPPRQTEQTITSAMVQVTLHTAPALRGVQRLPLVLCFTGFLFALLI